ncbi:PD-(D/E)XK motif protein [Puerhibacterium sp. TATVAM-FAB25]|uniref:PD-(D/E)XK motif protein n=1 Tax=Puerhibacterium sp. TATVAM-FAB25 TaxID=3093699 RepID=UPI00397C8916
MTSATFEALRARLERHPPAAAQDLRELVWADGQRSLAGSRDVNGALEVFIVGRALQAITPTLKAVLHHQVWQTSTGESLDANHIVLPDEANFPGVAAFICAELLANGLVADPQTAFARTEPVIAALLQREQIGSQVLVGLAGELLLLEALTRHAKSARWVAATWQGSAPSSRDFQLGPVGVEVKATTSASSTHSVQGFHQVELGHPDGGEPETDLYLLSVGLRWLPPTTDGGTSIPRLVDTIASRLDPEAQDQFLARVRQYGGDAGIGYDHARDSTDVRYSRRFLPAFERLYDMTDERIRLLRSNDVEGRPHIDPASISFRVVLPAQVNGDLNPIVGIEPIADHIVSTVDTHLER